MYSCLISIVCSMSLKLYLPPTKEWCLLAKQNDRQYQTKNRQHQEFMTIMCKRREVLFLFIYIYIFLTKPTRELNEFSEYSPKNMGIFNQTHSYYVGINIYFFFSLLLNILCKMRIFNIVILNKFMNNLITIIFWVKILF